MNYGFIRVACVSPQITVADCKRNADAVVGAVKKAAADGVSVAVFPELSLTGYTCGDLFAQKTLQQSARDALADTALRTADIPVLFAVGLPVAYGAALFNCAAVVYRGRILALIPKTAIPNYSEFYECRHFSSASVLNGEVRQLYISRDFPAVPFGTGILIADRTQPDIALAAEICEDLWVPQPPSVHHALAGATIIMNLSASNEVIGKKEYRKMLVSSQSGRLSCAYVYADAGTGESTTDLVFAAHNLIAENGTVLAESPLYDDGYVVCDIDTERLSQERRKLTTFPFNPENSRYLRIEIDFPECGVSEKDLPENSGSARSSAGGTFESGNNPLPVLRRFVDPHPFVPSGTAERRNRCREIIAMQGNGLAKRLRHTHVSHAVVGLSGGLDSTLALLVTAEAFRLVQLPVSGITAVTMPCFGTTDRTYRNACALAQSLGVELREIPISAAVMQHFSDIGHDPDIHDVTYENSQARERTQVLMDIANQTGGLVIGTGDLSELALGWATYNGDHMSMYGVNASIPKTLVRYLVEWFADEAEAAAGSAGAPLASVLRDILDTPVSPELLPPENGVIAQKTESIVGPYELHDFFLYYVVRWGFSPRKILFLAAQAFKGIYDAGTIKKWITVFYWRFFAQQFKRSCLPDGAKVGTVSLSPRGDWRMPSDASAAIWLLELEQLSVQ